jgi:putative phosphoribosyl transferase
MTQRSSIRERIFADRDQAGQVLAERLAERGLEGEKIVLGLPRGGVPIACRIAARLDAPVDVLVVRKLGAPFNPELAVGAVALGGIAVYNDELLVQLGLSDKALAAVREKELQELARRERCYRGKRPRPQLRDRTVILADDGLATGATMAAAVAAVRAMQPGRIVVAVPTGSVEAVQRLERIADQVEVLSMPEPYLGVGAWYERFEQLDDAQVVELLRAAGAGP